jgi:hypothetical protein
VQLRAKPLLFLIGKLARLLCQRLTRKSGQLHTIWHQILSAHPAMGDNDMGCMARCKRRGMAKQSLCHAVATHRHKYLS